MNFRKDQGFTILETMVAINLSFIVITTLIGFYLFINKFISISSNNLHNKINDDNSLNLISELLYKADCFSLNLSSDSIQIKINNKTVCYSPEEISVSNIFFIKDISLNSFIISIHDKGKIEWQREFNHRFQEEELTIESNKIENFSFEFEKNTKKMFIRYYQPSISANNFINIDK